MASFKGPLKHPPVVYVVCQIRFATFPRWDDVVRRVHESLADAGFARQDEVVQAVAIQQEGEPEVRKQLRSRFENRDATLGHILASDQWVTHQTSYTNFNDFFENIRRGFQALALAANVPFITRLGLRYVDLITARADESVDDYLHEQLRAFSPELRGDAGPSPVLRGSAQLCDWMLEGSRLMLRTSRARHKQPVTVDLLPVHLKFARQPPPDADSVILDIDHFVENLRVPPDWLRVGEQIRGLQEPMSRVFKAAITEHAIRRYNSELDQS